MILQTITCAAIICGLFALLLPALSAARGNGVKSAFNVDAAMLEQYLVGAFAYFAEDGETYGVTTVSKTSKVDVSANYDDVPSLGCVENAASPRETRNTEIFCPKATGGYERTTEAPQIGIYFDLTLTKANEWIHRLAFGKSSAIVQGTGFQPFAMADPKVNGWLHLNCVNMPASGTGATLVKLDLWCEMRLPDAPANSPDRQKPVLRFQVLDNSLNDANFPA